MWTRRILPLLCCAALLWGNAARIEASDELVVHEWGTFTALQDEEGRALTGINIDDEPLPGFVYNLNPYVLARSYSLRALQMKGAPQKHPFVTVRLETPVMYFYPPKSAAKPMTVDVDVALHGGWLTEFYPRADADAPGLSDNRFQFGPITDETVGSLSWKGVSLGTDAAGPETSEHVWTAPRQVASAGVTTSEGESERYLFYRGVGNFEAPLRVSTDLSSQALTIRGQAKNVLKSNEALAMGPLWLVHVLRDGRCAYRSVALLPVTSDSEAVAGTMSAAFDDRDFDKENMTRLQTSMHQSLVAGGLFTDEATAMLRTWERAYFKSPGLRLFFVVPQRWTDQRLPLRLSAPAAVTRVMMGRVELISPEQRQLLQQLSQAEITSAAWTQKVYDHPDAGNFFAGRSNFGDLGVALPREYQMYMDLGRFRSALIVAEEKQRPTPSLTRFIELYGLEQFRVEEPVAAVAASQSAE